MENDQHAVEGGRRQSLRPDRMKSQGARNRCAFSITWKSNLSFYPPLEIRSTLIEADLAAKVAEPPQNWDTMNEMVRCLDEESFY